MNRFDKLGVIKNESIFDDNKLEYFTKQIKIIRAKPVWNKQEIIDLFSYMIPEFNHKETGKYLDQRM